MPVRELWWTEHAGLWVRRLLVVVAVVAVGAAVVFEHRRENDTRKLLDQTKQIAAATHQQARTICAYVRGITREGNARYRFNVFLAHEHQVLLRTAADARERSAFLEAARSPRQARSDLETAADYRAQDKAMALELRTIRPRPLIRCPG